MVSNNFTDQLDKIFVVFKFIQFSMPVKKRDEFFY
jgi:hypothetical protein